MRRRYALMAVVFVAAVTVAVVNATAFIYRTLYGEVKVTDITAGQTEATIAQYGIACTGFYIKGAPSGNTIQTQDALPDAGTNNEALAGGNSTNWYGVKVVLGDKACEWTQSTTGETNTLYRDATAYINVTNGDWYFKDILGFGYPSVITSPAPIYVTLYVVTPLSNSNITNARLIVYNAATGALEASIDLKSTTMSTPIQLYPGDGLQIDLQLSTTGSVSSDSFTVRFYVATSPETPR
ncbi:hypothetical protein [Stetteria hydrogenophila]